MRSDWPRMIAALGLAGLCAACATTAQEDLFAAQDKNFGEAVEQTMALQIINPNPVYDEPMQGQGVQAASAIDRYVKGTVKRPDKVVTSSIAGLAGGGGGGR